MGAGERLCWQSSVDDVMIEVRFDPTAGGTIVRVLASIPAGGADRGGTFWVRVAPAWFGAWCARRARCARRGDAPPQPEDTARLGLAVSYAKPATAAHWLASVFGLQTPGMLPDDDAGRHWIEFRVGNCSLIIARLAGERPEGAPVTHVPWVFVDDLDGHFARAQASGAAIVEDIHQHGYRAYVADDLEGNRWTFAQARPTMR